MAKIIGIAFSDLHHNDWKQFNENDRRLAISESILFLLFTKAKKYGVPLLFPGDFFHTPNGLSTKLFELTMGFCYQLDKMGVEVFGITGNHDMSGTYSLYKGLAKAFPKTFICVDDEPAFFTPEGFDKPIAVYGIPYLKR